jgi:hypothetical protein
MATFYQDNRLYPAIVRGAIERAGVSSTPSVVSTAFARWRGAIPGLNRSLPSVVPFSGTDRSGLARARSGLAVCALLLAA